MRHGKLSPRSVFDIYMDIALIVGLILLGGLFAMSEIAIVASNKARLQVAAEEGDGGARAALRLSDDPTRFLSAIQVGITLIGILSGAFGEAAIARKLEIVLLDTGLSAAYAKPAAWTLMVIAITYVTLVLGELVPKRLAMMNPEMIARLVARPMDFLASAARPLVWILTLSTHFMLKLLRAEPKPQPDLIEEEIQSLIKQGTETGVLDQSEQAMLKNILRLDNKRVGNIMVLRDDMDLVDLTKTPQVNMEQIKSSPFSFLPVCEGDPTQITGILSVRQVLVAATITPAPDFRSLVNRVLSVPYDLTLLQLLEQFGTSHHDMAIAVDHVGRAVGLVTITDAMAAITGHNTRSALKTNADFVHLDEGSWLVSGRVDIASFKDTFGLRRTTFLEDRQYHTLAGYIVASLDHVPRIGEVLQLPEMTFEVISMKQNRIEKVKVTPLSDKGTPA